LQSSLREVEAASQAVSRHVNWLDNAEALKVHLDPQEKEEKKEKAEKKETLDKEVQKVPVARPARLEIQDREVCRASRVWQELLEDPLVRLDRLGHQVHLEAEDG
jgi:hypothetical protein